ncbi:MAG: exo-alpha-sialidase [Verrucomicrobia bacterium]|nr:exo-alpha-sialidase [Verrucomicrobiota bacterium]
MRPHPISSIRSAVGAGLSARGPRVGGLARAFILASLMGVPMCLAADTKAVDVERWIHPAFSASTLQLPGTFDQQTVVVLADGRLMTVPPKGNATVVSSDAGRTWSEPRPIRPETAPVVPTRGPLIRTRSGVLILLFQHITGEEARWDEVKRDWTPAFRSDLWVTRSHDDGKTWDEPQHPFAGVYGSITSAIQIRSGRVIVPVEVALQEPGRWGTYVFVSADDGLTWTRSNLIDLGGNGHHDGAIEAAVTELSDRRLMMLIRTSLDRFWEVYSDDHGYNWREWRPSRLDAGAAPGYIQRLASGRLVLVWNRLSREGAALSPKSSSSAAYYYGARGQRSELSISYSDDDAKNWTPPVVIVRQTKLSLSYPFVLERSPGELWIWTRYGSSPPVYLSLHEQDLVDRVKRAPPGSNPTVKTVQPNEIP